MEHRQLDIRGDKTFADDSAPAGQLSKVTTEVVDGALEVGESTVVPQDERGFTPERRHLHESIVTAAAELPKHMSPGGTFDDSWMYEENGLPK